MSTGGRFAVASNHTVSRVVVPTALTALTSTGLAVVVNLATGGGHSMWMWVAVAVLTLCGFGVSLWAQNRQPASAAPEPTGEVAFTDVHARDLRAERVKAPGGFKVKKGRLRGDISINDLDARRGDASHP